MLNIISYQTTFPSKDSALASLPAFSALQACLGARVHPVIDNDHGWALQAFFEDVGGPLCDGCKRSQIDPIILASLRSNLDLLKE